MGDAAVERQIRETQREEAFGKEKPDARQHWQQRHVIEGNIAVEHRAVHHAAPGLRVDAFVGVARPASCRYRAWRTNAASASAPITNSILPPMACATRFTRRF